MELNEYQNKLFGCFICRVMIKNDELDEIYSLIQSMDMSEDIHSDLLVLMDSWLKLSLRKLNEQYKIEKERYELIQQLCSGFYLSRHNNNHLRILNMINLVREEIISNDINIQKYKWDLFIKRM